MTPLVAWSCCSAWVDACRWEAGSLTPVLAVAGVDLWHRWRFCEGTAVALWPEAEASWVAPMPEARTVCACRPCIAAKTRQIAGVEGAEIALKVQ